MMSHCWADPSAIARRVTASPLDEAPADTTGFGRQRPRSRHGSLPDGQLRTRLTTQRCLPISRSRVNPWRSNIGTVPLWRKEPETLRLLVFSG